MKLTKSQLVEIIKEELDANEVTDAQIDRNVRRAGRYHDLSGGQRKKFGKHVPLSSSELSKIRKQAAASETGDVNIGGEAGVGSWQSRMSQGDDPRWHGLRTIDTGAMAGLNPERQGDYMQLLHKTGKWSQLPKGDPDRADYMKWRKTKGYKFKKKPVQAVEKPVSKAPDAVVVPGLDYRAPEDVDANIEEYDPEVSTVKAGGETVAREKWPSKTHRDLVKKGIESTGGDPHDYQRIKIPKQIEESTKLTKSQLVEFIKEELDNLYEEGEIPVPGLDYRDPEELFTSTALGAEGYRAQRALAMAARPPQRSEEDVEASIADSTLRRYKPAENVLGVRGE